jgi:hypothetical protein
MRDEEHHVQDALELYAVALLQRMAEDRDVAISQDADAKRQAFEEYAARRGYTQTDFQDGRWSAYKRAYDKHLPVFFDRLVSTIRGQHFDFINVEVENRNAQRKGDFLIVTTGGQGISVSLKNYRNGALRPQLNSGTYNSFILNFLFESPGVGTFRDPTTGKTFRSTPPEERDRALAANGYAAIIPFMTQMDALNTSIRARFIDTPEFEFINEDLFDRARKECGEAGAGLALQILAHIDKTRLRARGVLERRTSPSPSGVRASGLTS